MLRDETPVWRVMVRPRWIAALLLALAVSAVFAGLSQWQLERAVATADVPTVNTEKVVPLTSIAKPEGAITTESGGRMVSASGHYVPGDERILSDRVNEGETGFWVVSHFTLDQVDAAGNPVALAVARGWAPSRKAAEAAVSALAAEGTASTTLTGRLLPTEAPIAPDPDGDPDELRGMSVASLYNLWSDVANTDVYSAYVVQRSAPAGLATIFSPPPVNDVSLNWLNVFYAIEWVVFAGFAVYLWYRLVRDATERINLTAQELMAEESMLHSSVDSGAIKVE